MGLTIGLNFNKICVYSSVDCINITLYLGPDST